MINHCSEDSLGKWLSQRNPGLLILGMHHAEDINNISDSQKSAYPALVGKIRTF